MLVGHNPGMTMFAESLVDITTDNMPTCSIFCVEFALKSWKKVYESSGTCVFFDYPKKHQR